jgi:hypothetical protein
MTRRKEKQDLAIVQAVSGSESLVSPGVQIEPGYLERERLENLREQGFLVEIPDITYSDVERIIRRSYRDMEEVEGRRCNRKVFEDEWGNPIYDGGDADDIRGELIRRKIYL